MHATLELNIKVGLCLPTARSRKLHLCSSFDPVLAKAALIRRAASISRMSQILTMTERVRASHRHAQCCCPMPRAAFALECMALQSLHSSSSGRMNKVLGPSPLYPSASRNAHNSVTHRCLRTKQTAAL